MSAAASRTPRQGAARVQKIATLEADPQGGRFWRFIASSNVVDRYGDIVEQVWELDHFWANPVFLWSHESWGLPIGSVRSFDVHQTDQRAETIARVEFLPEGTDEFVDKLFKLVELRAIRAVSVGFIPLETEDLEDEDGYWTGWRYTRSELCELSLCTVPANPDAVSLARSLDPSAKFLRRVCADPFTRTPPPASPAIASPAAPPLATDQTFVRRSAAMLKLHRFKLGEWGTP